MEPSIKAATLFPSTSATTIASPLPHKVIQKIQWGDEDDDLRDFSYGMDDEDMVLEEVKEIEKGSESGVGDTTNSIAENRYMKLFQASSERRLKTRQEQIKVAVNGDGGNDDTIANKCISIISDAEHEDAQLLLDADFTNAQQSNEAYRLNLQGTTGLDDVDGNDGDLPPPISARQPTLLLNDAQPPQSTQSSSFVLSFLLKEMDSIQLQSKEKLQEQKRARARLEKRAAISISRHLLWHFALEKHTPALNKFKNDLKRSVESRQKDSIQCIIRHFHMWYARKQFLPKLKEMVRHAEQARQTIIEGLKVYAKGFVIRQRFREQLTQATTNATNKCASSATLIQAYWRGYCARKQHEKEIKHIKQRVKMGFENRRQSALKIHACIQCWYAKGMYKDLLETKKYQVEEELTRQRLLENAVILQKCCRGWLERFAVKRKLRSIVKIQALWRGVLLRSKLSNIMKAVYFMSSNHKTSYDADNSNFDADINDGDNLDSMLLKDLDSFENDMIEGVHGSKTVVTLLHQPPKPKEPQSPQAQQHLVDKPTLDTDDNEWSGRDTPTGVHHDYQEKLVVGKPEPIPSSKNWVEKQVQQPRHSLPPVSDRGHPRSSTSQPVSRSSSATSTASRQHSATFHKTTKHPTSLTATNNTSTPSFNGRNVAELRRKRRVQMARRAHLQ
eukprot:m.26674 g.26674  ORF g.26674 m.26674 type:complete len:673 (-) comp5877_c0_seq1:99-2117(-)